MSGHPAHQLNVPREKGLCAPRILAIFFKQPVEACEESLMPQNIAFVFNILWY